MYPNKERPFTNENGVEHIDEQSFGELSIPEKEQYKTQTGHMFLEDDIRNKSMRYNAGKPQLSYPMSTGVALEGVARVMEFGAEKYEKNNWKKGLNPESILDSMLRHIRAYLDGEYIDSDSKLPHVDHISCNALFLGYHTDRETGDGRK